MAFLKRAVAISSIVRVILRMLRMLLRRLSSARALAIVFYFHLLTYSPLTYSLLFKTRLEVVDCAGQRRLELRGQLFLLGDLAANVAFQVPHVLQELLLKCSHAGEWNIVERPAVRRKDDHDLVHNLQRLILGLLEDFDHAVAAVKARL